MADNVYECMFILDSNRYARDPNAVSGKIPEMIEKSGGEVLASRLWNEQKLAFPIAGQRKGTYWLTYFRMASERVAQFNHECRLNDSVLRNLTLKVEPRLVDALVAHALGKSAAPPEGEAAPKSEGEAAPKTEGEAAPKTEGEAAPKTEGEAAPAAQSGE